MAAMAVAGISWALGLAGKVESQQEQIAALQAEVANRRGAMNLIEGAQRDLARLEREIEQIQQTLERTRQVASDYKIKIAQMDEHLEAVDERLLQVERAFGWRSEQGSERGLGHN
jgi:predicted  nucleic acid-binding Zn-ribbon protein